MYNTPVEEMLLFPFLQMEKYFRCDFFHLLTTLISRRRKAEWTAVAALLEWKTNKYLCENNLQGEHSTCPFWVSVSEVTSSMAAIYPRSPSAEGKEGSQHIKNLQLLLSIYALWYPPPVWSVAPVVYLLGSLVIWCWMIWKMMTTRKQKLKIQSLCEE